MLLRRLSLLLALAWMALIFYSSHHPIPSTPSLFPGQDKLFHALVFGTLGILVLGALPRGPAGYSWHQAGVSVLIVSLYGLSDEIHQHFIAGRSSEILDWLADTLGALITISFLVWLSRKGKSASVTC